ncbi:Uma2 family endonuclease [Geobacillus genomosp. 3]|uniref:Uma2 family endonuclease n=1 Tax=Geobacillus genomosp. 3 TaxID=1921421 RepID=S5Z5Z3_GEOG3|nr:Uma2 family endonuclease [Geobacillus genomosp. 3]AGT32302.1 Uma2 family endonuclease [Geobacillus genomosp. 3]
MDVKPTERQKERYTYQDYVKWDGWWELINGVPYNMAPAPSFVHQFIVGELYVALRAFFREKGCTVVMAPFDVRLDEQADYEQAKHVVQPDISVICDQSQIGSRGCDGPPDLVVEVLSPSTALKDRNEKYMLYEQFDVKEYWIVDPLHRTVEVYGRGEKGYEKRSVFGEGDVLVSFLFADLTVSLAGIFQNIEGEG